jgi:RNA polymerase sigma-70 factor (ECF subfamily)
VGESGELDHYHLFHAARADILLRMNRLEEAATAYQRALALTSNLIEQDFLKRRLDKLRKE